MVNAKWRQRRLLNIETDLFEEQMDKQKEKIDAAYEAYPASVERSFAFRTLSESGCVAMLNFTESRLERAYTRALNTLLRLQRLRESNRAARKQDSAKRTESQERTLIINPSPPAQNEQIPPAPPPSAELTPPGSSTAPDLSFQLNRRDRPPLAESREPAGNTDSDAPQLDDSALNSLA